MLFYTRYMQRGYKEDNWSDPVTIPVSNLSRVEAGSNTSLVALRVVGGDKKGSLESETVKYGRESHGIRTREWLRWWGPAAIVNGRAVLSSETAPYVNKTATVWQ
jgi:hypothetical protein